MTIARTRAFIPMGARALMIAMAKTSARRSSYGRKWEESQRDKAMFQERAETFAGAFDSKLEM
eukprot:406007-Amphidinium_carterae.2